MAIIAKCVVCEGIVIDGMHERPCSPRQRPRTAEQERADVVAWLQEQNSNMTPYFAGCAIERGEHVGASWKEKKP